MNKFVLSVVIVAVIAVALGTTSFVSAQGPTPQAPVSGYGMMGGRGARGGMNQSQVSGVGAGVNTAGSLDGLLHDGMVAVYAETLGITLEDLNARLENGETMAQIASAQGLTVDQFNALMTDARLQAVDQAVQNGTLTQEQADWMNLRGAGLTKGGRGMRGTGQGQYAADCPYSQTNP
jgi:hypothetical protein